MKVKYYLQKKSRPVVERPGLPLGFRGYLRQGAFLERSGQHAVVVNVEVEDAFTVDSELAAEGKRNGLIAVDIKDIYGCAFELFVGDVHQSEVERIGIEVENKVDILFAVGEVE